MLEKALPLIQVWVEQMSHLPYREETPAAKSYGTRFDVYRSGIMPLMLIIGCT